MHAQGKAIACHAWQQGRAAWRVTPAKQRPPRQSRLAAPLLLTVAPPPLFPCSPVAVLLAGAGALLLHMRRRRSATQPLDAEQALKGLKGGSPQGQRGPQALGGKGHQVEELELMRRQRAGAGAIAAAAAGSSGGESDPLKSDELLTWISSHPPPATPSLDGSGGCGGTPLSATSAGGSVGGSSVASAASSVMPRGGASPSSAGGSAKYLRWGPRGRAGWVDEWVGVWVSSATGTRVRIFTRGSFMRSWQLHSHFTCQVPSCHLQRD